MLPPFRYSVERTSTLLSRRMRRPWSHAQAVQWLAVRMPGGPVTPMHHTTAVLQLTIQLRAMAVCLFVCVFVCVCVSVCERERVCVSLYLCVCVEVV